MLICHIAVIIMLMLDLYIEIAGIRRDYYLKSGLYRAL